MISHQILNVDRIEVALGYQLYIQENSFLQYCKQTWEMIKKNSDSERYHRPVELRDFSADQEVSSTH